MWITKNNSDTNTNVLNNNIVINNNTKLLELRHGMRVGCLIQPTHWYEISDCKIYISKNGQYFICQDEAGNLNTKSQKEKRFGYKYSYLIGKHSEHYLNDCFPKYKVDNFKTFFELEILEKKLVGNINRNNKFKKDEFLKKIRKLASDYTEKEIKKAVEGENLTKTEVVSLLRKFYPYDDKVVWLETPSDFCTLMKEELNKGNEIEERLWDFPLGKSNDCAWVRIKEIPNNIIGETNGFDTLETPFFKKERNSGVFSNLFDKLTNEFKVEFFVSDKIINKDEDFAVHKLELDSFRDFVFASIRGYNLGSHYGNVSAFGFYDKYLFDNKYKTEQMKKFMRNCSGWYFTKGTIYLIEKRKIN